MSGWGDMTKRKNTPIKISFWGVRGSIPSHSSKNIRYGGHTACVSIAYGGQWFVCDAGTGIRVLGEKLASVKAPVAIFLSHLHWDHVFGLPFFKPLYQKKRKIVLAGPSQGGKSFKSLLSKIMRSPYFPIGPVKWRSNIRWKNLKNGSSRVGPVRVATRWVKHSDKTLGFEFLFPGGRRVVYVADQELSMADRGFARWVAGADLLVHDAQYDRKTYAAHKGWGHSAFETVLELAMKARVKKLVLSHHDPAASDRLLEGRLVWCRRRAKSLKSPIRIYLAKEGSTLVV